MSRHAPHMDRELIGWLVFGGMVTLAVAGISFSIYRKEYLRFALRGTLTAGFLFLGYFGAMWALGEGLDAILSRGSFLTVALVIGIPFTTGALCEWILKHLSRRRSI